MTIDDKLITYLEELSRLSLSDDEKESAKNNLGSIIAHMEILNTLDTEDCPALSHPFPASNRFREDKVCESYSTADILANAAAKTEEYFKVPKTVE